MESNTSKIDAVVLNFEPYRHSKRKTLSDMEQAVERAKQDAAQQAMRSLLDELGPEDDQPKSCPKCGHPVSVHTRNVGRSLRSLHGEHQVKRHYYFCRSCQLGFCPRDAQLGLPKDGSLSLEMERRVLDFAVSGPYEECAERWAVHYPQAKFSSNQFRQVAERVGKRAEQSERRRL
jgi:hypothetical protein